MAKKKAAAAKAKPKKAAKKSAKPAAKKAVKAAPAKAPAKPTKPVLKPVASESDEPVAAPKVLKPLTMKQKLALIKIDPMTGKCPHGLIPDTCAFCMSIF